MHAAGMLLGCLLLAADPDGHSARSADIVAEAMQLPAGSAVTGQRLTLLAALSSTSDRGQQLKIVRAYWRLVEAAADYTFCRDHVKGLERHQNGRPGGRALAAGGGRRGGATPRRRAVPRCGPSTSWPNWCGCRPARRRRCPPMLRWFCGTTRSSISCLPPERRPTGHGCRTKRFRFNIRPSKIGRRRCRRPTMRWTAVTENYQRRPRRRGGRGRVQPRTAATAAGVHRNRMRLQPQHRRLRPAVVAADHDSRRSWSRFCSARRRRRAVRPVRAATRPCVPPAPTSRSCRVRCGSPAATSRRSRRRATAGRGPRRRPRRCPTR